MVSGTLYYFDNPQAYRILIAAKYGKSNLRLLNSAPDFILGVTNKKPEFLKRFPLGKVPAFEESVSNVGSSTPDLSRFGKSVDKLEENPTPSKSLTLNETCAISQHVGPTITPGLRSQELQWVSFSERVLCPAISILVLEGPPLHSAAYQHATDCLDRILVYLDEKLQEITNKNEDQKFLLAFDVTLSDITLFCELIPALKKVGVKKRVLSHTYIQKWCEYCMEEKHFLDVLGKMDLTTSEDKEIELERQRAIAKEQDRLERNKKNDSTSEEEDDDDKDDDLSNDDDNDVDDSFNNDKVGDDDSEQKLKEKIDKDEGIYADVNDGGEDKEVHIVVENDSDIDKISTSNSKSNTEEEQMEIQDEESL